MAEIRRFGKVIGIKESRIYDYKKLHADTHMGVRFLISQAYITNFQFLFKSSMTVNLISSAILNTREMTMTLIW